MDAKEIFEKLEKAKKNVIWLLDNEHGLVDMHSLSYWAKEVERLRKRIKKFL